MRIHSNGCLLRTTNKKVVLRLKDGSSQEWSFEKYPDKQKLIADIADYSYELADNHEKGKFNIITFAIALTKYLLKRDEDLFRKVSPLTVIDPQETDGWLKKISLIPHSNVVSKFTPEKRNDLNDLARFFIRNPFH